MLVIDESSFTETLTNTDPLYIGRALPSSGLHFDGNIDEARVWNTVRTVDQIRENMCQTLVGNESDLVAYYNCNSSSGTTLYDISSNSVNGTLQNAPTWVASTAFNMWFGGTSTAWATDANWSSGSAPGSTSNVGIKSDGSSPEITSVVTINNIVVGDGATLTYNHSDSHTISGNAFNIGTSNINSGNLLTVTGSLYVLPLSTLNIKAGGELTTGNKLEVLNTGNCNLLSDATGTGSLIVNGTSSGDVTAQRYVDEATSKGYTWHYISSPVAEQDLDGTWIGNNSILFNDPAYQLYRFGEDTDYWIYYGYVGSEPENFGDATFVEARGYAATRTEAGTYSFTGTVRTNDVTYAASYTSDKGKGWNLVGNPFTSALAVTTDATTTDKFLTNATNLSLLDDNYTALYIWNEGAEYVSGDDDYQVIGSPISGSYTEIDQDYIQPGQAFMVKVSSAGNLQFTENMQAHASVDFYKEEKDPWPSVELIVKNDELFNSTAIGFNDNMTLGLDPSYDVGKLKGNPNIALYTRLIEDNGVDFAIQALPDSDIANLIIPVGIDIAEAAICEFSINTVAMESYPIYLEDRQEHTVTNLKDDNYNILVSNNGTGRFYLHFKEVLGIDEPTTTTQLIQTWASNNTINIFNKQNLSGDVVVVNMYGQAIVNAKLSGDVNQQILVNAPSGYYIVNIVTNKGVVNSKVYLK